MWEVKPPDRNLLDARGLLVVGTHPQCGKSVACAGLAGVLNDLGFTVQAIKPFSFQPEVTIRDGYEQAFFDRLSPPRQPLELFSKPSPRKVTAGDWQHLQELCRKRVYPYILEAPGSLASPIRFVDLELNDAVDLSKALEIPLVLVTAKSPDLIGVMAPMLSYLWSRDAKAIGWMAVETHPTRVPEWEQDVLFLRGHTDVPYLGEIAYSPSISVEAMQQGNLFRITELGVDLLPIQQALNLLVPF
ncbi:ATP-dependent dethiobiotin synthetase [Microcystis phage MaAM05]|nr:ATP-dependent dethiobiotin synthetase [Microcystis phage MaAM05]